MSKLRRCFNVFLVTVLILSVSGIAFAIENSNSANSTGEQMHLVIATTDNSPLSIDRLLYTALRDIRIEVDFVSPIVREGYTQANDNVIDGVIAGYPNLHTVYENLRQVPVILERINVRVFAREGSQMRINSWSELDGLHVGILENRTYILERLPDSVTITEKVTSRALLDGLVNEEYEVVVLVERDHETHGERHSITRIGDVDLLTEYLYMHKSHEALIPQITSALENLINNGTADKILNDVLTQDSDQKKTVVHILSTSIELQREDQFISDLRESFVNDMSIDWMTINLDSRRHSRGQFSLPLLASILRADLVSKSVAAVIVSGDVALDFLKDYYYLFFRNVPVLFYGTSERSIDVLQDYDYHYQFTGIVKNIEAKATVEQALIMFPDTERLLVINDFTAEGQKYRADIEADLTGFSSHPNLSITYNENLTAVTLLEQIGGLSDNSLLFVGSYFVDSEHQYFTLSESKRLLERYSKTPIFSVYSTELEYNAVGGKCLDYQKYAVEISTMLRQLLDGKSAEEIPIIYDSTSFNRWVFDKEQLDAFKLSKNNLPEGSEIINTVPSIRESNPQFFVSMIIIMIVGTLFIIGACIFIIVNRRHTKQKDILQNELVIEKSVLEGIFNSVPEILFAKDLEHNFIRINKSFEEHFGCKSEDIVGSNGYGNKLLASVVDDYMETEKTVLREKRFILTETRIKGVSGNAPVFEIIATPLISNGEVKGIVGAAYDVTHRIKMEEATQAASRAKSNFLANMSHEMRTPLTAVIGLTELTLETVQLDDETYSNLIKVYRSGETILNLVNDILDISKIEADRLALNPIRFDLPSLLNDTITQSALYIDDKPIKLVLKLEPDLPNYLFGDELRIKQLLNNLLSNAFKFTKEGTVELGVKCQRDGDDIWMTAWVKDTGVGIKPEDMDRLFTLYGKMEEDNMRVRADRRIEGTGLGLSISKKVVDMMNGSINVESEYGEGSTFTVNLKLKYVNDETIGTEVIESLKNFDYSIKSFEHAKMTRLNLSYARILIVDDNSTNLDVAKGLMGLYGMTIDCLTGGQEAIDTIRSRKVEYDAIFMDHMMPGIDGVEATRIIREEIDSKYAKSVPIIALTANAVTGNEEMFLSRGFQAFIAKPIDVARLDLVLRQWVRNKDAEALLTDKIINIETTRRSKDRRLIRSDIPEIDIEKGIIHFGYNEETLLKVLESFLNNTRPLLSIIKGVTIDKLVTYGVTIHGIKGSSRGIFASKIGDEAEALEKAANNGDYSFVLENNQQFLDNMTTMLINIENALIKTRVEEKAKKDKPEKPLLKKLLDACESFDIDEIDTVMAEIELYDYTSDDGLVAWLRNIINQGKYKSVKDKLSAFINDTEV
ncbi:MAG: ATP-binding protein [Oscillospiraceae bacterium]|nr:ATP-binding protein [Oscillospiraceae bacterium]